MFVTGFYFFILFCFHFKRSYKKKPHDRREVTAQQFNWGAAHFTKYIRTFIHLQTLSKLNRNEKHYFLTACLVCKNIIILLKQDVHFQTDKSLLYIMKVVNGVNISLFEREKKQGNKANLSTFPSFFAFILLSMFALIKVWCDTVKNERKIYRS